MTLKTRDCDRCRRPQVVCLCSSLPKTPLALQGKLLLLQHPHEAKKRMATVPLLHLCLRDCITLQGRKFSVEEHQSLGMAMRTAVTMACPIYILFPSPDATDLSEAVKISGQAERASTPADKSTEGSCSPEAWSYLLIAIDGTWREAKEMYKELKPTLEGFDITVVHLPRRISTELAENRDCLLRREPALGCVTTAEAIARALALLEGNEEVKSVLMAPLRRMTALQAQFDPAMRARMENGSNMHSRSKGAFGFRMPFAE